MCGLSGVVMLDGERPADPAVAERMADVQYHRGPDAGGLWAEGPVALGHRRLRIIDLSERAAQPMHTADGRFVIVYNGEIYNYAALRRELAEGGVRFRSESDTEVLLELFVRWGRGLLDRVNGIFAFAIWDRRERRLFAARDPMGVKPLYWAADAGRFLFASEMKAIAAAGWPNELDEARVGEYLLFGSTAAEATLVRGIRRLSPGGYLELAPGRSAPSFGTHFDPAAIGPRGPTDPVEAARVVRSTLETAVDRQLVSDVPVGSMCSGGIDSSVVTALSARRHPRIDTYCIRVPGSRFDESAQGREASAFCGTEHHEIDTRPGDVNDLLGTLVWLHDEPLAHPNSVAIFQISRLARERVTVLLSGEGADEIFAGYSTYRRVATLALVRRAVPRFVLRAVAGVARGARRGLDQVLGAAGAADLPAVLLAMGMKTDPGAVASLAPEIPIEYDARRTLAESACRAAGKDAVLAALLNDQRTHLCTLLDRQDKMCMGTSIESRVPFLDVDLVRLANSLPSRLKCGTRGEKRVLRDAARGALPESIRTRRKWAFGLPLADWFGPKGGLWATVGEPSDWELVRRGVVSGAGLLGLVARVRAGDSTLVELLWYAANLEIWLRVQAGKIRPDLAELPAWRTRPRENAPAPTAERSTAS